MPSASLSKALLEFAAAKAGAEDAATKFAAAEENLINALRAAGQKTTSVVLPSGDSVTGTLVAGTRVTLDEEALKKSLGATKWRKVVKTVLDKAKLEAQVAVGNIDQNVVAAASTLMDIKPYIKAGGSWASAEVPKVIKAQANGRRVVRPRTKSVP